jgi:hypothetical protein
MIRIVRPTSDLLRTTYAVLQIDSTLVIAEVVVEQRPSARAGWRTASRWERSYSRTPAPAVPADVAAEALAVARAAITW